MIIAISGKIGSGKDLVNKIIHFHIANYINPQISRKSLDDWPDDCRELEQYSDFETKSFAGKIKDVVCLLIGCTRSDLEDREFKEEPLDESWTVSKDMFTNSYSRDGKMTPRLLLQLLGTDCGRNIIHPNIWINALFADYKKIDGKYPNWIVTDSRFKNDDAALKERGAIRLRVNRPNNDIKSKNSNHESETDLDDVNDFDEIIKNDSGIPELSEKVRLILIKHKIIH